MTTLTVREAYEALLVFLQHEWRLTHSDELAGLLGGYQFLSDGGTADPAAWQDWLDAVAAVRAKRRGDDELAGSAAARPLVTPVTRGFHSPDVDDLEDHRPTSDVIEVLVQMFVGPADGEGSESFDVVVVSPAVLARRAAAAPVWGAQLLVVDRWDWPAIEATLRDRVSASAAEDWDGVGIRLGRFARWEFEDYQEHRSHEDP